MSDTYWIISSRPIDYDDLDDDKLPEPISLDLPSSAERLRARYLQLTHLAPGVAVPETPADATLRAAFVLHGLDRRQISDLSRQPATAIRGGAFADQDRLLIHEIPADGPNLLHPELMPTALDQLLAPRLPLAEHTPLVLAVPSLNTDCSRLPFVETLPVAYNVASSHDFWSDLPLLWFDHPRARLVRLQLYRVLNQMLIQHLSQPLADWCGEHGLELTSFGDDELDLQEQLLRYAGPDITVSTPGAHDEGDSAPESVDGCILILDPSEGASAELRRDLHHDHEAVPSANLDAMTSSFHAALDTALHHAYFVALGLERDIDRSGDALEGHYIIGSARYPVVVLPESPTWRHKTLCYIEHFVRQGGTLILLGEQPTEVDCEDAVDRWRDALAHPNVHRLPADGTGLAALLDADHAHDHGDCDH